MGKTITRPVTVIMCALLMLVMSAAGPVAAGRATVVGNDSVRLDWDIDNSVYYGDRNTPIFTTTQTSGEVSFAYCVDPTTVAPSAGTYGTAPIEQVCPGWADEVRAGMWFCYGGPGFDPDMWPATWSDGSSWTGDNYYAASHLILSQLARQSAGHTYYRAGTEFINYAAGSFMGIDNLGNVVNPDATLFQIIARADEVPADFNCYFLNVGQWDVEQYICCQDYYAEPVQAGSLEIVKASSLPAVTSGNSCYSLKGAMFGIYADEACTELVISVTAGSDGHATVDDLSEGTYWVKELTAPAGFALNTSAQRVDVPAGDTVTVTMADIPQTALQPLLLIKLDAETDSVAQGSATLAGAEFTVCYYAGIYDAETLPAQPTRTWVFATDAQGRVTLDDGWYISGDELFRDGQGNAVLPLGTVTITETKAPDGYMLSDTAAHLITIAAEDAARQNVTFTAVTVTDTVTRGGLRVYKTDAETGTAQGDATLEGTEFSIVSLNDDPVLIDGVLYSSGETVMKIYTDAAGMAETGAYDLPFGTYAVTETKAPAGYLSADQTVRIETNGVIVEFGRPFENDVKRGGIALRKVDAETGKAEPQGGATLAGARFGIVNASASSVMVGGEEFLPGETVMTITTDETGFATTGANALPYGTYTVIELSAPEGYLPSTESQSVRIREENAIVELEVAWQDQIMRGGLSVQKLDETTGSNEPLAAGTLCGTSFAISNANEHDVLVDGVCYAPGEVICVLTTDVYGYAATGASDLPFGSYSVTEICPPEGYAPGTGQAQSVVIAEDGVIVPCGMPFANRIKRGDMEGIKVEDETGNAMGGVAFLITSLTTGEHHILVADDEGFFSTASSAAVHTFNTNDNDAALGPDGTVIDESVLSPFNGIWFFGAADSVGEPDDTLGALPFDKYHVEELLTEASYGHTLVSFDVAVRSDGITVDLGAVDDRMVTLQTQAILASTGYAEGPAGSDALIIDTVSYAGLAAGMTYELRYELIDRATGEPVAAQAEDAEEPPSETGFFFTSDTGSGSVEICCPIDASDLAGHRIVVCEYLFLDGQEIASHADCADDDQTVSFVAIGTTAAGQVSATHEEQVCEPTVLVDTVAYTGLSPQVSYTLESVLMDRATGAPFEDDEGEPVVAFTEFTPEDTSGTVDTVFTFTAAKHVGATTVAFETLRRDEVIIVEHTDIDDDQQSVTLIDIGTEALDRATQTHTGTTAADAAIIDTVTYQGLIPGETYTLIGSLVDRQSGEIVYADPETPSTVSVNFIPESTDGTVEIVFEVDSSGWDGRSVVVFEHLEHDGAIIASHADFDDADQTVTWSDQPVIEPVQPVDESLPSIPKTAQQDGYVFVFLISLGAVACVAGITMLIVNRFTRPDRLS